MADAYTLAEDDPARPVVEESLSRLESRYSAFMQRATSGAALADEDRAEISLFVGALHARTRGMMASRQAFFDKITGFARQMMGDVIDKTVEPWGDVTDAGKRQIAPSSEGFAQVAAPHMLLLAQTTPLPFVTSDHPVTHMMAHADELAAMGIPDDWFYANIPRSARAFFVFCPLTPRLAYLSSGFFRPRPLTPWPTTDDPRLLFALNEIVRTNADGEVYGPSSTPYGPLLPLVAIHDKARAAAVAHPESFIQAYSATDRYVISTTYVQLGRGAHPLTGRIRFRTDDMDALRALATEHEIVSLEVVREGSVSGGMRGAWFVQVALDPNEESVIENGPIPPI